MSDEYKLFSHTSSGWSISENRRAPRDRRWRAQHPVYGEKFFAEHDDILPFTCQHMAEQFAERMKHHTGPLDVTAVCLNCAGRWHVAGARDPAVLEGVCKDCQSDSDVEKPLLFVFSLDASALPKLPKEWLA